MTAAMMRFYGFDAAPTDVCNAMVAMLTGPAGLQFRTPAGDRGAEELIVVVLVTAVASGHANLRGRVQQTSGAGPDS